MAEQRYFPESARQFPSDLQQWIEDVNRTDKRHEEGSILSGFLNDLNSKTPSAGQLPYATGTDSAAFTDFTAQARTFLAAATAAAQRQAIDLPGSISDGDLWYGSGGDMTALAAGTNNYVLKSSSGTPTWSASGGGGLALEAEATADGTSESLQVTATTTPSDIRRLIAFSRSFVPENDGDNINCTFILDDDTELTTANSYKWVFWLSIGAAFSEGTFSSNKFDMTATGNAAGEYNSQKLELIGGNGSQTVKQFEQTGILVDSSGTLNAFRRYMFITTSKNIKGVRWDTDNTGDMINAPSRAELWVQTA